MADLEPETLQGTVVILFPWAVREEQFASLRDKFSTLKIIIRHKPFGSKVLNDVVSDEVLKDAIVLLTPSTALPTIEQVPKLQYVQITSAGANLILNNPLYRDTDIVFCNASGVHGPQIAEWVVSTYLGFKHHLHKYQDLQRQRKWQRLTEPVYDANDRTVGILGYGSIGRQVARVCQAVGMNVHAYTLHSKQTPESRRSPSTLPEGLGDPEGTIPSKWFSGETQEELHKFLASDIDLLVIALPLTTKTTHLIGRAELQVLSKNKTFVSNIARGTIIKTDHIIEALNSDWISGAALDVQDPEPLPEDHPLWDAPNLILTPHISGNSTVSSTRVLEIFEHNLQRLSKREKLVNIIDREENY